MELETARIVLVVALFVGAMARTLLPAMRKMDGDWSQFSPRYLATAITTVAGGGWLFWENAGVILAAVPVASSLPTLAALGLFAGLVGTDAMNTLIKIKATVDEEVLIEVPEAPDINE